MLAPANMPHRALEAADLIGILQLIRSPRIGPATFFNLLARCGSVNEAIARAPDLARRGGSDTPLQITPRETIEKEIEVTTETGARFVLYGNDDYPNLLQQVADAPPVLVVKGSPDTWKNKHCIALVGARNASAASCKFAQILARDLAALNFCVVSGLARGIDSFAHRGALETATVGVIAGGIDTLYPPENVPLYQRMAQTGAIISEFAITQQPLAKNFPKRNRIIAGMSEGTVVIEASPRSGSLITARLAGEYNRELFAVPGSPMDPRSLGCNQLLRDGAHLLEKAEDVLNVIQQFQHEFSETPEPAFQSPAPRLNEAELDSLRLNLLDKLGTAPVSVDELIEQCQTSAQYVNAVVLELELAGRITRSSGNTIILNIEIEEVA